MKKKSLASLVILAGLGLSNAPKQAFAFAPPDIALLNCDAAQVTEHPYGPGQENNIIINFFNAQVNSYLLTRNSGSIINGDYFGIPNGPGPATDVTYMSVDTYSNQAVSSGEDYSGSLGMADNGSKEIRVLHDQQNNLLTVSLFNNATQQEDANWIFRGCTAP